MVLCFVVSVLGVFVFCVVLIVGVCLCELFVSVFACVCVSCVVCMRSYVCLCVFYEFF